MEEKSIFVKKMRKWGKHKQITTVRGPAYNSEARRRNSIQIYHMISIEVPFPKLKSSIPASKQAY
jgi:hypothetical protein